MQLPEKYGQAQLVYGIYSCVSSIVQYGFPGYKAQIATSYIYPSEIQYLCQVCRGFAL